MAANHTCNANVDDVDYQISMIDSEGTFTGTIKKGDDKLEQLGKCITVNRPSTTFTRCTFIDGDYRFEVYPRAERPGGAFEKPRAVVWYKDTPAELNLDCK